MSYQPGSFAAATGAAPSAPRLSSVATPTYRPGSFAASAAGPAAPRRSLFTGAPAAKKKGGGGGSLFDQFKALATGLPAGIFGLGKDVATELAAPVRIGVDIARGDLAPSDIPGAVLPGVSGGEKYHPLLEHVAQSGLRTSGDILHPERFAQAVREGTIVGKAAEDIGNVAMIGGPLAKALGTTGAVAGETAGLGAGEVAAEAAAAATRPLGLAGAAQELGLPRAAAGLERAGQVVRGVTHLGERTGLAQGPAAIFATPYKALSALTERAGLEGGISGAIRKAVESPFGERHLFTFTDKGQQFKAVEGGRAAEIRLHPVDLGYGMRLTQSGVPRLASPATARVILERLQRLSETYGTTIRIQDNVGVIHPG